MSQEPGVSPSCVGDGEEPPRREDEQPVPTGLSLGRGRMERDNGSTVPSENLRDWAWNIKQTKKETAGKVMPIKDKK